MTKSEFIETLNEWGRKKIPFLFLVDFEIQKPIAIKLIEVDPQEIFFSINGFSNDSHKNNASNVEVKLEFQNDAISYQEYKSKFDFIKDRLCYGDSFLTNLTKKTAIKLNQSLQQLYFLAKAKYKLFYKDEFLMFSPETFIKIENEKIFSYPMKGTIDASIENAKEIILSDAKETAEHITIVDLIRNDLSAVATDVKVTKFRYVDEVKTTSKNLLQVSSEVEGKLPPNYLSNLGTLLVSSLPAGSVSGAPKTKTLEIIRTAEGEDRGFYTGVFGYFDGTVLDSGVMIRYIEKQGDQFHYRSGGGITAQSEIQKEYQELIDKIYVPVD